MEEKMKEPDFVCNPVPYNYTKCYEGRKGKFRWAAILFAAFVIGVSASIRSVLLVFLLLFGAAKWHSLLTGREYKKKIEKYEKNWFSGCFTPEFLMIENVERQRKFYYYNDIEVVEETGEYYRVVGAEETLVIPKMYLERDAVRAVRHHFMRYCTERCEQKFIEEEEKIRLELPGRSGISDSRISEKSVREIREDYLRYIRSCGRFYYTEARIWMLGGCLYYLLWIALSDFGFATRAVRIGLILIAMFVPAVRGCLYLAGKISAGKSEQRLRKGIPAVLEIDRNGVSFQTEKKLFQSWKQIRKLGEGTTFFVIGKLFLTKKRLTKEQTGQIRALCQKYGRQSYQFVEAEPQKTSETVRTFLPVLCYVLLVVLLLAGINGIRHTASGKPGSGTVTVSSKADDGQGEKQDFNDKKTEGSKETIYVLSPDKDALRLTGTAVQMNDCYSSNETNELSRFYITPDGILYGASANHYGELGLGNTESYLTAKGFYREMEIAQGVIHVSLGNEFMVYLTDSGQLMGAGNLPGVGSSYVSVELMEGVQYVKCSAYGMIILKEDGSVWCAGTLYDEDGNVIRQYSGFEQVMEHAVFVSAGRRTMAVVQTDGSLWMWGDNKSQQCGVSTRVAETFSEPVHVRDNVQMVWPDRLSFSSAREYQGYLAEGPNPYVSDRTYILQKNGDTYACGDGLAGEDAFMEVVITEE